MSYCGNAVLCWECKTKVSIAQSLITSTNSILSEGMKTSTVYLFKIKLGKLTNERTVMRKGDTNFEHIILHITVTLTS